MNNGANSLSVCIPHHFLHKCKRAQRKPSSSSTGTVRAAAENKSRTRIQETIEQLTRSECTQQVRTSEPTTTSYHAIDTTVTWSPVSCNHRRHVHGHAQRVSKAFAGRNYSPELRTSRRRRRRLIQKYIELNQQNRLW